jgi:hypothetical protein
MMRQRITLQRCAWRAVHAGCVDSIVRWSQHAASAERVVVSCHHSNDAARRSATSACVVAWLFADAALPAEGARRHQSNKLS